MIGKAFSADYYYHAREGDTIQNIFNAYFQSAYSGNEISDVDIDFKVFFENVKLKNPRIYNWHNLKSGTMIEVPEVSQDKSKLSFGFFYTASQGSFAEKLKTNSTTVNSNQVSPITFGFMSQLQFKGTNSVLPISAYVSHLNASSISGAEGRADEKLNIPLEIGGNLYYQYSLVSLHLSPYVGFDFEKFTTFNAADLENGDPLTTRQNSLLYATGGLGYNFLYDQFKIYVKASYSKSINSSTTSQKSEDRFTGNRYMLYLNIKKSGPFLMHLFYKYHQLTGPTELSINRVGIGFGYIIF
ncbi:MAG: hypothetical protein KBD76_09175 [Bacteriovorax sp.]|nr:hypothetical protein [Bacteriovorax sp.]